MQLRRFRLLILIPCLAIFAMAGCNIFSPIDHPSNDDQLQSAARACFDNGDLACALDLYSKLSANRPDTAASESAFAILDQNGLSMGVLMGAVGGGGSGGMLNSLAAALAPGAGATKRVAIYSAYKTVASITDPSLRGLVRFITGLALASEILAEQVTPLAVLNQTDITSDPTGCNTTTCLTPSTAACAPKGTAVISDIGTTIDLVGSPATSVVTGTPTWEMVNAALLAVQKALDPTELGASGKFSSGAGGFANSVGAQGAPLTSATSQCYRVLLISLGVGVKS